MRLLELFFRVYIQDGIYRMIGDYHLKKLNKYLLDDSNDRYTYHTKKCMYWNDMFWKNQKRNDEIINYYTEKIKGLN